MQCIHFAYFPKLCGCIQSAYVSDNPYIYVEKKNQLDVTEFFIALMIHSTCFGHFYAHCQELETVCVLLPLMVCTVLGCWLSGVRCRIAGYASRKRDVARVVQHASSRTHSLLSCTDPRQPATKHSTP